ncbi:hypothetical protein Dip510_001444 [Elusimicrobium posterum]|uniref:hypothetical protein n=1 Tax=Elusimicrobium posterum TaxID=3116653 RepID=UPI003C729E42
MNIKFLLSKHKIKKSSKEMADYDFLFVEDAKEAKEQKKNGFKNNFTYDVERLFRLLELNEDFLKVEKAFKEKYNLPPNSSFKFYNNVVNMGIISKKGKYDSNRMNEIREKIDLIYEKYNMHSLVADNLDCLLVSSFVLVGMPKDVTVTLGLQKKDLPWNFRQSFGVNISIKSGNMTLNTFQTEIRKIWKKEIQPLMKSLPTTNLKLLSDRDVEIVQMRRSGQTFGAIANKIFFSRKNSKINEDNAAKAYKRGEKIISSLFSLK